MATSITGAQLDQKLLQLNQECRHVVWHQHDGYALQTTLIFKSFREAIGFMMQVALLSEQQEHHPDWSNSYRTVVVKLRSHDIDGISERDFQLARSIDQVLR